MSLNTPHARRWLGALFLGGFLAIFAFAFFVVARPAFAQEGTSNPATGSTIAGLKALEGACSGLYPCPAEGSSESLEQLDEDIFKPALQTALLSVLLNLVQYVLDRLAYEAAVAIASGGEGETSLIFTETPSEAWKSFGLDIAGEAIGELGDVTSTALNVEFDVCTPPNDLIRLALQLGIKQAYQPQEPRCDFQELVNNWDSFITTTIQTATNPSEEVLEAFAQGLRPGQNELSAALSLNIKVHEKVLQVKSQKFMEQLTGDGFQDLTDIVTGQVQTPSSVLQQQFNAQLQESRTKGTEFNMQAVINNSHLVGTMLMQVSGVFVNTLLSTLFNRIYTGLFEPEPLPDPFDVETIGLSGRDEASERFASLITANPINISDYNAIAEFVTCPSGGVSVRNVNNCVMDANFAAAVTRAEAGTALTVQEAIDEGLLQGSWALIGSTDYAKNQDPFCYTYGYCYGNLVKMRKARVIPVGWEIAAERNNEGATLQDIVDAFDDCNDQGTIDEDTHKFCHLIDPNWVLKYPETQCRAYVNGEVLVSTLAGGRAGYCADTPSCVSEDNEGNCTGGYGYCVKEKNVWRFRGDECPEQYASCLSFENTFTGDQADLLLTTVDYSVCNADNAGCRWYRTQKYYDDAGTPDDTTDDTYEWLPTGDTFLTAAREDDVQYDGSSRTTYTTDSGDYTVYAYEDRVYFNNNVEECSSAAAGCTELFQVDNSLVLNVVANPSFEDDEDEDGVPDAWDWYTAAETYETAGDAFFGTDSIILGSSVGLVQENIAVSPNAFYTFSFYALAETSGSQMEAFINVYDEDGTEMVFTGTSYDTTEDCVRGSLDRGYDMLVSPDTAEWSRYECTFTTLSEPGFARIWLAPYAAGDVRIDGIQLEQGEDASSFVREYNSATPTTVYLLVAPDELGCDGGADDPPECDTYTQACTAQDAGCNLYTPDDGDPAIPAITSSLDACPSECVGYTTYKQEATLYDEEEFPLYFIADRAESCAAEYVGCDSFTNLDTVDEGGEGVENYTYLRACLTEEMADGSNNKTAATYFTWEGSDATGYQLMTWRLLESNTGAANDINYSQDTDGDGTRDVSDGDYDGDIRDDENAGQAPCANWEVSSEAELICRDVVFETDLEADDTCNEHSDILDNPDCREFYDANGNIHYRLFSQTVTVSDECHPYRKTESSETDCDASGGYWAADRGECRYFGLAEESTECPAVAAGCREYTGGAGRNATTVFEDTFEDGDVAGFGSNGSASITLSNESLAADGHSLRVVTGGTDSSVTTSQTYLDWSNTSLTYDADNSATTCTDIDPSRYSVTSLGCEIDIDSDGVGDCTVQEGDNACGTLDDQLIAGKTYVLSFWAKGDNDLNITFVEEGGAGDSHAFSSVDLELDGSWQLYEVGPLDTTDFTAFDDTAIVSFNTVASSTIYLDNIQLKAVEENITIVKDSWVVPESCDTSPTGTESPQYYLGCEAYTDQDGNDGTFYQFSDLCSEQVVGCEAFFDTQNSESAYGEAYNVRCVNDTDGDVTTEETVSTNTACSMDGEEVCTISTGRSYCTFDSVQALPNPLPSNIVLGPEAVVVTNDTSIYLVNDGNTSCDAESMGCEEVGVPTYSQDRSEVTAFESTYLINLPDSYDNILCDNEALFCEEWSSTQDGNFYFKDPGEQTCEYKTSVTINNSDYRGWFRTGTDEPCYWDDTDGDDAFDPSVDDSYLISGEEFGVWRNGDDEFAGWAAACSGQYDLCTEFIDEVDTGEGLYPDGTSYYFTDDELLDEDTLPDSQRCDGQVSQKEGCALFNNTNEPELLYASEPSYIISEHADFFYGDDEQSLQNPIDCDAGGGEITPIATGTTIDVCEMRCRYTVGTDNDLQIGNTVRGIGTGENVFAGACITDEDCPVLLGDDGENYSGECIDLRGTINEDSARFQNDANEILKVNRDRECAAWLACSSAQVSWNPRTSKYENICSDVGLCVEYSTTGDTSSCTQWAETDPVLLTDIEYANRDVSWNGLEYSGYSIPEALPIDTLSQANINPDKWCENAGSVMYENGLPIPCSNDSDCGSGAAVTCESAEEDLRLVHVAGPCDDGSVGYGGTCQTGFCEEGGQTCSSDVDCGAGDECVIGYCQGLSTTTCTSDDTCTDADFPVCDTVQGVCVNELTPNADTCVDVSDCSVPGTATCTPAAVSKTGECYNDLCLTKINDVSLSDDATIELLQAQVSECRGYPETTSPYPISIVEEWGYQPDADNNGEADETNMTTTTATSGLEAWAQPYTLAFGFQGVSSCAPDADGRVSDDCICSYDKAQYGDGVATRYYPIGTSSDDVLEGVCVGGDLAGFTCDTDDDCQASSTSAGTCATLDRKDSIFGWEGYCLEKDTSIQLFGSSDADDRACLTWLPVDQLAGSTDLYGKYEEAGFDDGNVYYCADVTLAYDVLTTGLGCAEVTDGNCNDGDWTDFMNESDGASSATNDCIGSMYCPEGYFGILGGCGDQSADVTGDGQTECRNNSGWDNDCPFFCVPKGSFKTDEDGGGTEGDECDIPAAVGITSQRTKNLNDVTRDVAESGVYGPLDVSVYYLQPTDFATAWTYYDDCTVRGVTDSLMEYTQPATEVGELPPSYYGSKGFYGLSYNYEPYAACTSLIQVSSDSAYDTGEFNAAWTDRVWTHPSAVFDYTIVSADNDFDFEPTTALTVFGEAIDYRDIEALDDPFPHRALMCEKDPETYGSYSATNPPADRSASCPAGFVWSDAANGEAAGMDASAYLSIDVTAGSAVDVSAYCANASCDCSPSTEAEDCNWDSGTGALAVCNSGSCDGGINDGQTCEEDGDCQPIVCGSTQTEGTEYTFYFCELQTEYGLAQNEDDSALIDRLQQIFARSYEIITFTDGYEGIADVAAGSVDFDSVGSFAVDDENTDWVWDVTDTGYGSEEPEPPTVLSIGECFGTLCREGDEDAFTVNGQDSGTVFGSSGQSHVSVSFFTYADPDQMPIRNIIVDWGDGDFEDAGDWAWPTDSQDGSKNETNYYKNHRGLQSWSQDESICEDGDEWGINSESCDASYLTFVHDYVCTDTMPAELSAAGRTCSTDEDANGVPDFSPCTVSGSECVFIPRVSVKDNWGWCTGFCDVGDDGTDNCYDGSIDGTENECDWDECPGGDSCLESSSTSIDPWVYYDGWVEVTP